MELFTSLLLWLHFIGMAAGLGSGLALAQTGPRLVRSPPDQRELLWTLETFFSRIGAAGLLVLLITGPLMVWLRFGGVEGFSVWFWVKMACVAVAIAGVGAHQWAARRFHDGDKSAIPMMFIAGRAAGVGVALAMLAAVFTFN